MCQACALLIYALRASGTASLFMGFAHIMHFVHQHPCWV
ncbi:hypothetical protein GCHA_4362 [Paraglaciecola chathamensis S18K6]|uniref:Uncharacterized protein n=1 Tax=Paraglaciecola chathamensis S18K6 TaxID=1127672 RepID=A0AAV3V6X6_9ALTE|nr:hypothetical protein GCHA_4362 [Paraglaciecola chathamensis S18K6]